jgi:predicted nucleic-acid-binding Zn-ribbon protein
MKKITQCPKCGANKFIVIERGLWEGEVNEVDGALLLSSVANDCDSIETISCEECGQEFNQKQFTNIYFC